jgi:hypothetical protein
LALLPPSPGSAGVVAALAAAGATPPRIAATAMVAASRLGASMVAFPPDISILLVSMIVTS